LHRQRDWVALRAIASSDAAVRPEVADALAFWSGNRKGDAA